MAVLSHCLAQAKRLSLLAVLSVFCLGLTLPAKAICRDATAFGNGFEKQLKEEQPASGQEACTGVWLDMDGEGRIGLFMGNNLLNNIDPYGLVNYESWPFIGPVVSNARLNAFARQHSDAQGNSFQDYNDMKRYLNEKRHYNNPQGYQSGDIATVQGIEDLTKAAATTYVIAATSVTPTAAGTKCVNLLLPGGKALGQAGTKATIRELQGGLKEAQALFDELSQGGKVVSGSTYKGTLVELPEGGTIGIRTDMTRSPGTAATIDINIPNIPINKVKFNP